MYRRRQIYKMRPLIALLVLAVLLGSLCLYTHLFSGIQDTKSTTGPEPTPIQTSAPISTPTHMPKPTPTPTHVPTPSPTPTLDDVMKQSSQYDCCGIDNNISDIEATTIPDEGTIQVLVKVYNLAWPQVPLDVGKALIFQYMAAAFTSSYTHKSVTVIVMFRGGPEGMMSATQSQETENGTHWGETDAFDYWNYYDMTEVSPSIR